MDGEYSLLERIGPGSSRVYRVRRLRDGQLFVARVAHGASKLELEAALVKLTVASRVRHPAVAALETFRAQDDGSFVIVSEFVPGRSLDVWANATGIPPLPRVIALVHRVCAGLHAADRLGLAHDALYPGNLLVAQQGADARPQLKIIGLGVPAFMRPWPPPRELAQFMAPEKLQAVLADDRAGAEADARSSVYSCGCLLYDLCTGGAPFQGGDLREIAAAHEAGRLTAPARINPQIPALLEEIILMALARAPRERFARCAELARALASIKVSSTSSSGVRPLAVHALSAPPPPGDIPTLEEQDARATARSNFDEPPTVERQLPEGWQALSALSETSAPDASAPITVRPPPAASAPAIPPPPPRAASEDPSSRLSPAPAPHPFANAGAAPAARSSAPPFAPSAKARGGQPIAAQGPTTPIEPLWIGQVIESARLARVEPDRLVAITESQSRYVMYTEGTRARARARSARIAVYGALGLIAGAAGFLGVRGLASGGSAPAPAAVSASPEGGAPQPSDALARSAPSPRLPYAAVEPTHEAPRMQASAPEHGDSAQAMPSRPAERRPRAPGAAVPARTAARSERESSESATAHIAQAASEPAPVAAESAKPADDSEAENSAGAQAPARDPLAPSGQLLPLTLEHRTAPAPAPAPAVRPAPSPAPAPTPRAGGGTLQVDGLDVRGSLATSEVRRALDRIKPQLSSCFARASTAPSARPLQVEIDIDERGRARSPRVTGSSSPELARCIAQVAAKLVSATPPDTGTVKATFALGLSP